MLAIGLLILYLVIMAVPPIRSFFELTPLSLRAWLAIAAGTLIWALVLWLVWRTRILERVLAVQPR